MTMRDEVNIETSSIHKELADSANKKTRSMFDL